MGSPLFQATPHFIWTQKLQMEKSTTISRKRNSAAASSQPRSTYWLATAARPALKSARLMATSKSTKQTPDKPLNAFLRHRLRSGQAGNRQRPQSGAQRTGHPLRFERRQDRDHSRKRKGRSHRRRCYAFKGAARNCHRQALQTRGRPSERETGRGGYFFNWARAARTQDSARVGRRESKGNHSRHQIAEF